MNKPQTHLIDLLFLTLPFPSTIKNPQFTHSPFTHSLIHNYLLPIAHYLLPISHQHSPLDSFYFFLGSSKFTHSPIHNYLSPIAHYLLPLAHQHFPLGSFYFLLVSSPSPTLHLAPYISHPAPVNNFSLRTNE